MHPAAFTWVLSLSLQAAAGDDPAPVTVHDAAEFRAALSAAKPGARINVAPGIYEGGFTFVNLRGTEQHSIVISGADPAHPPVFRGGSSGIQLSDPEYVQLQDLVFEKQTGNGLNIDDGGSMESPALHVVLLRLTVRDIGPKGNCDGIKLSGADNFVLEGCTVERWGEGGSAVDMVGCRRGILRGCVFRNPLDVVCANGVQAKGGSRDIGIERCRFENAGSRAVNIGGSTGLEYFRPPISSWTEPRFEALDIFVDGNTFIGSDAPVAFVGADSAFVRFNTIYLPKRWAMRILQETREEDFVPCRAGEFSDNLVVFRSDSWSEGGVNCGPGTEPKSFRFERNVWSCIDDLPRTRAAVRLPADEVGGVYGVDPLFKDAAKGDLTLREGSPAAMAGADAFKD